MGAFLRRLAWLENGNSNAGLKHIIIRHGKDFETCQRKSRPFFEK